MTNPPGLLESRKKPTIEELKRLMDTILLVPRPWGLGVIVGILVSLFQVTRMATGGYVVNFQATSTTVALAVAFWLPSAIRLVAAAGGVLPTPAGEASTPGLTSLFDKLDLSPDAQRAAIAPLAAAIETSPTANDPVIQEARRSIESELEKLPVTQQQARLELQRLADLYRDIRMNFAPGARRTTQMAQVAIEARSLAADANYSADEIHKLMGSDHEGDRIIGISAAERLRDPRYFEDLLGVIDHPKSAFEQYRAMVAVMAMLPKLVPERQRQLINVLNHQRSGQEGTWISRDDASRWDLAEELVNRMRARLLGSAGTLDA